jgi:nicotinamidase-related amidase
MKKKLFVLFLFAMSCLLLTNFLSAQNKGVKPALLVIDIQNEFLKYMSEDDKKLGMEMINASIMTFRKFNLPVIRVYHTNLGWGPNPGSESFEYPKSILIKDDDPKIIKNFPSAFQKTDLDKILKEKGCNTLYLCGLSAVGCVLATYFGSIERDYKVFMLKDCIISHNSAYTTMIKDICESISFQTMAFQLEHMK